MDWVTWVWNLEGGAAGSDSGRIGVCGVGFNSGVGLNCGRWFVWGLTPAWLRCFQRSKVFVSVSRLWTAACVMSRSVRSWLWTAAGLLVAKLVGRSCRESQLPAGFELAVNKT